jgi:hypothetical protein
LIACEFIHRDKILPVNLSTGLKSCCKSIHRDKNHAANLFKGIKIMLQIYSKG